MKATMNGELDLMAFFRRAFEDAPIPMSPALTATFAVKGDPKGLIDAMVEARLLVEVIAVGETHYLTNPEE